MRRFFLIAVLVTLPFVAAAETPERPPSVIRAEQYLNGLGTARARFLQTAPDGSQLIGTFYLNRPGKLRFEYDKIKDFIVADGFLIYFYDAQLGQQTNAPIGQTLADFLLRPDLSLSGDITVSGIKRSGGLLQITLYQTDDHAEGSLTLGFTENPLALKKWRVADSTGAVTEVELFKMETGMDLPNKLFYYNDPERFEGNRYND